MNLLSEQNGFLPIRHQTSAQISVASCESRVDNKKRTRIVCKSRRRIHGRLVSVSCCPALKGSFGGAGGRHSAHWMRAREFLG